ncbi:hypothetical protein [Streptomyces sp. c-19]|uniref:hypothetical protein n=1 Tax=Streptomyces sp. c-19 TaxID=2789275 RepID=UPI0039804531
MFIRVSIRMFLCMSIRMTDTLPHCRKRAINVRSMADTRRTIRLPAAPATPASHPVRPLVNGLFPTSRDR